MRTLLTTLHSKYIHASLALPYLAAYCRNTCDEILIREYTLKEPKETILAQIVACRPDVVCFSVYLWNRVATLELVDCLKRIDPGLRIVLGGPEISFEDERFFSHHPVDALICGEGERPFRELLLAWQDDRVPDPFPGLRTCSDPVDRGRSLLASLDDIPSPFVMDLVDLKRGLVYFESSRGCPYSCSFCMSALDDQVRSFSAGRISDDLTLLMECRVPQIKFVDRTFNYDNARAREIFSHILKHNRSSRFHFEIGAHLFDDETLDLLETVPDGMFQFEIGVQSTLPQTLAAIERKAPLDRLLENVRRLRQRTAIHLHLDLVAGLPGEGLEDFLRSLDRVDGLHAGHVQLELVKLLPGAPLRAQAERFGIIYDPNPPYTILRSQELDYSQLEKLRGIGRLLDLIVNSRRFLFLLPALKERFGGLSAFLDDLDRYWRKHELYRRSLSLRELYFTVHDYLVHSFDDQYRRVSQELLARDYAHQERVVGGSAPEFFDTDLSVEEVALVKDRVKEELDGLKRDGKVQFFAAAFRHLPECSERRILIFLYLTASGKGLRVKELFL